MVMDGDARIAFNNSLLSDWERAMDRFFENVQAKQEGAKLTDQEVAEALTAGYGSEVADAWIDWVEA